MRSTLVWTTLVAASLAASVWPSATRAAPALKEPPTGGPWPGKDPAIYLGCGEVQGAGTVVQLDMTGKVLGTVALTNTPYGLAADRAGLIAALPARGAGKVVRIGRAGKVETILEDATRLPAPIAVAADPTTGDLLVADNAADVLLLLPGGEAKKALRVLAIRGHEAHLQDMSVAFAADGNLLFGGTGPVGVYRFKNGDGVALGDPVFSERGAVAAASGSKRWAAALTNGLRVFEGDRESIAMAYPAGRRLWHETLAFGQGGAPIVALHLGGNKFEVVRANLERKEFETLFQWSESRVVSITVGPKLPWKD